MKKLIAKLFGLHTDADKQLAFHKGYQEGKFQGFNSGFESGRNSVNNK